MIFSIKNDDYDIKNRDLMIKNSDKTLHNIHSMSEVNSAFNFAMPAKSDPSIKKFEIEA